MMQHDFDLDELSAIGRYEIEKDRLGEGISYLKTYLKQGGEDPEVKSLLANAYLKVNLSEKAMPLLEAYLSSNTSDYQAKFNYVMIFHDQGDYAKAKSELSEVLNISPEFPPAQFFYAVCLHNIGEVTTTVELLNQLANTLDANNFYHKESLKLKAQIAANAA